MYLPAGKMLTIKQTVFVLFIVALWSTASKTAEADINFRHCQGPIDLGGNEKEGKINNACVKNHHFQNETHAWVIKNSLVKDTNFTSCTFRNAGRTTQSFWGTVWENVIFKDSVFASAVAGPTSASSKSSFIPESLLLFHNISMHNVQFVNCTFEEGVDMVFLDFGFHQVLFQECKFFGTVFALRGLFERVIVEKSIFGNALMKFSNNSSAAVDSSRYKGDLYFSHVKVSGFDYFENDGVNNTFGVGSAMVRDFRISRSSLGSFTCEVRWDKISQLDIPYKCDVSSSPKGQCDETAHMTQMNDTFFRNVTFQDGIHCKRLTGDYLSIRNVGIDNMIDLSNSDITDLILDNIVGGPSSRTTNISLNGGTIKREKLNNLLTTNVSMRDATFTEAMLFANLSISDARVDVRNTMFVQERIGGECCSTVCETRGCICAIAHKAIWCPEANVTTRSGKQGSCFPGDALLRTRDESGTIVETRMDSVSIGMEAVGKVWEEHENSSEDISLGRVFFFGHKDANRRDLFVKLAVSVYGNETIAWESRRAARTTTVVVSREHLMGVLGRGYVTADSVGVGEQVMTVWGRGRVMDKGYVWSRGLYAPVTTSGDMVVNGVLVSCFTEHVDYVTATALLVPLRWVLVIAGRKIGERVLRHASWLHERSGLGVVNGLRNVIR